MKRTRSVATSVRDGTYQSRSNNSSAVFACSTSSNLAAMVERTEGKDTVALYSLPDWLPLRRVPLTTLEAVGVEWSPDGRHVAVIENPVPVRNCLLLNFTYALFLVWRTHCGP